MEKKEKKLRKIQKKRERRYYIMKYDSQGMK